VSTAKQTPPERVLAFQSKPEGPSGKLTIIRDTGFVGGGCYYTISINGTLAARLDTGEKSTFFVPVGEVLLRAGRDPLGNALCSVGQDEWTQRETIISSHDEKYFRLSIDANGKTDIQRTEP
jgi:hypothetical protein